MVPVCITPHAPPNPHVPAPPTCVRASSKLSTRGSISFTTSPRTWSVSWALSSRWGQANAGRSHTGLRNGGASVGGGEAADAESGCRMRMK